MQRMISPRKRQNAEARALPGSSWPASWPAIGLSPAEKQPAVLLLFETKQVAERWMAQQGLHFHCTLKDPS